MRGERERVADRVRELLAIPAPEGAPRRYRWDPGRRGAIALAVAVLVAALVTLWWVLRTPAQSVPVSVAGPLPTTASGTADVGPSALPGSSPSTVSATTPAEIVVDVAGKVLRPGLYRLPADARVYDAVRAAGGARPGVDTVTINLAAPMQDGQQIVVGVRGGATAGPAPDPVGSSAAAPPVVDLNTATSDQLDALPGVGPVTAQHILEWRDQHGQFTSISQLQDVSGIGPAKFGAIKDLVTL